MTCTCAESAPEPWQRPLLTQRRGARLDAQASRVKGAYIDGEYVHSAVATAVLAERSAQRRGALDLSAGFAPGEVSRGSYSTKAARGDARRWGDPSNAFAAAGGGGNAKVGPGWSSDAPRFDAGEIELVINGERCIQNTHGAWLTADGEPCVGAR